MAQQRIACYGPSSHGAGTPCAGPGGILPIPKETLAALAGMPDRLEGLVRAVPADRLSFTPSSWDGIPGEHFSPLGQVCHIRDIERDGYRIRFRRTIEERCPRLVSLDGYALEKERRYAQASLDDALDDFREARDENLRLLLSLDEEHLARRAEFEGPVTLRALVEYLASHDRQHLACLHWLLAKIDVHQALAAASKTRISGC